MVIEASRSPKNLGYWQMIATFLQACLGFLIGVVQCALIYVGLRRMGQASDERRDQHEEAMRALEVQHEALQELITRTAK